MHVLETLINTGGDADTTCAIAGGIWGVKYSKAMLGACKGRIAEPKLTPKFMCLLSEQAEEASQTQSAQSPKRFGGVLTLIRNLLLLPPY